MSQADAIGLAMRMVVPVRREFARNINVHRLLQDEAYARETLDLVHTSSNDRLRQQGAELERLLFGSLTTPLPLANMPIQKSEPPPDPPSWEEQEVARRYRGGLR